VLLCGNPDMIKEGIVALEERGLRRHKRREPGHITTEKYW
jgi:ferredoxin--NADP+ reductase